MSEQMTVPRPAQLLDVPARLEIAFEAGVPVALNGVPMVLEELVECVATIALNHGIGRSAARPRTVDEASATTLLAEAHDALVYHAEAANGLVRMDLFRGQHTVTLAAPATPERDERQQPTHDPDPSSATLHS